MKKRRLQEELFLLFLSLGMPMCVYSTSLGLFTTLGMSLCVYSTSLSLGRNSTSLDNHQSFSLDPVFKSHEFFLLKWGSFFKGHNSQLKNKPTQHAAKAFLEIFHVFFLVLSSSDITHLCSSKIMCIIQFYPLI